LALVVLGQAQIQQAQAAQIQYFHPLLL